MKRLTLSSTSALALLGLLATACGGEGGGDQPPIPVRDAGSMPQDGEPITPPDAAPRPDAAPDAAPSPDAETDAAPPADAAPPVDAAPANDAAPPADAAPDAAPAPDAEPPDLSRLVINELDYAQAGEDTAEYVEIYNASDAPARLVGVALELINGRDGAAYSRVELSVAGRELAAGAYLVVGAPVVLQTLPQGTLSVPLDGQIQNGPSDAVRLVSARTPPETVLDAVAYAGAFEPAGEGSPAPSDRDNGPGGLSRCENGVDTGDNGADFKPAVGTPGADNLCPPPAPTRVDLTVTPAQVLTRDAFELGVDLDLVALPGGLELNVTFEPETAAVGPATLTVPEGALRVDIGGYFAGAQAVQAVATVATADGVLMAAAPFEVVAAPPPAREPLVIDEVDVDQPGADTAEFIEIFNPGARPAPLLGLVVEQVNAAGEVYATQALDAAIGPEGTPVLALGPNQRLVVGAPAVLAGLPPEAAGIVLDGSIQNAAGNALRIVDTLNPMRAVLDAVALGSNPVGAGEGAATEVVDANAEVVLSVNRCPSGADTNDNATDFGWGAPTPGAANVCLAALRAVVVPGRVLTGEAFVVEVEAGRRAPIGGAPVSVTFDPIGPVCDAAPMIPEGQRRATIRCVAGDVGEVRHNVIVVAGDDTAVAALDVGAPPAFSLNLVIDEIDYDQPGADTQEFVEILNVGALAPLDGVYLELYDGAGRGLVGEVALSDAAAALQPGERLVVGQPDVLALLSPEIPSVLLPGALENGPDAVRLVNRAAGSVEVLDAIAYEGAIDGQGEGRVSGLADQAPDEALSLSRCPSGADTNDNAADLRLALPSPGTSDLCPARLAAALAPAEVVAGGSTFLDVTLDVPAGAGGVEIGLASDPVGAVEAVSPLVMPEGARRARFELAARGEPGAVTVRVSLDGVEQALALTIAARAAPRAQIVINEFDYEQEGNDLAEFVELFNAAPTDVALDGLYLELVNGANGAVYANIDLAQAGAALAAGGYLVVGAAPVLAALPAGTLSVALPAALQNGAPDGLRLVDRNAGVTLDGVAYEGELAGVGEGASAPEDLGPRALARFPNGADTDDNSADFRLRAPSPGVGNLDTPTLSASVTPVEVQVGELFTLTVNLPAPAAPGGVVVDVAAAPFEAVLPVDALVVPAGVQSAQFVFAAGDAAGPVQLFVRALGDEVIVDLTLLPPPPAPGVLVINELDYDLEGADGAEFVELYNGSDAAVPLAALSLQLINGATGMPVEYGLVALGAGGVLEPGQYAIIGAQATLADVPAGVATVATPGAFTLQNGPSDGIALIDTTSGAVLDAVVYDGALAGAGEGRPAPTDGGLGAQSLSRCPNGLDSGDNAQDFAVAAPTKGTPNLCAAP